MHCFNFSVNSLLSEASTVHQLWAELAEKTQPGPRSALATGEPGLNSRLAEPTEARASC